MARHLYAPLFVQLAGTALPAPNLSFTVWTDLRAGTNVTAQLANPDGSAGYTAVTDSQGNIPPFTGPDGYMGPLFADTGAAYRFEFDVSPDLLSYLISNVGQGGGGVTDHGALSGLGDDDHPQYHNDARGDIRYYTKAISDSNLSSAISTSSTADRNRTNHSGTQLSSSISDFTSAVQAVPGFGGGSSGGSGAFGTLIYVIPASDLTAWPANGTDAQKNAAVNANDARVIHEMVTRPGYRIEADPSQWWPLSADINEFVGTYTTPSGTTGNLVEGADYALGGRFLMCRGTGADATSGFISGNVLNITRKSGNGGLVVTPTNLRSVTLGGTPNLGSYFTAVCSGFDVTTNLNLYKAGNLLDLVSQNDYGYSQRAGYGDGTPGTGVYKGAFFPIAGLCINVTGYSLTAMNTAIGGGTKTTMERRTIVGGTSGVTALVQGGDFGANGQLLVNSVSGNWSSGEQIKDQATGAVIATYSSTTVCMSGSLNCAYDNTPQIRFVTRSRVDVGRMMIKPDGEIDDVIENYNRPDAVFLTGCTSVNVDGLTILGGYSTGLNLRSCFNVTGMVHISDLPNHALESLTERAYGYAVRWLGHCQNAYVGLDIKRVRHGTTSNAIRGSWNLNSRTGSTSGATSLCTNFWNHGPGMRKVTLYGKVENTWSACWDFHEGAEDVLLSSPVAIQPSGSGRATTAPDGFSIRGFGITILNPYTDGCRLGIYDLAGPLDSSGMTYTNTYLGGRFLRCQAGIFMQSEDTFDESLASVDFRGNSGTCDPLAKNVYQQFAMLLRKGNINIVGNRFSSVGYAMVRATSFVGTGGSNATGHALIRNNEFDFTDSSASRSVSVEATYDEIYEDNHIRANPVAGTQRPLQRIVNSGGNSTIRYSKGSTSHLSTTQNDPSTTPNVTAGTPTLISVDSAGGTSTPTHNNSVTPTLTAGAAQGTTPPAMSFEQTNITSTDTYGEVKFGTGTSATTGVMFTLTFGTPFATKPQVSFVCSSNGLTDRRVYVQTADISTTAVVFNCGAALASSAAAAVYKLTYSISGV